MPERNFEIDRFIEQVNTWALRRDEALEREEAQNFIESHGILPIERRKSLLLSVLNESEKKQLDEMNEHVQALEEGIKHTPEVERLKYLPQLGGKVNPKEVQEDTILVRPAFHTRYEHSELLAELAKFAALKLKLTLPEVKTILAAAWFHDIGHPAFSHVGDELLKQSGEGAHEKRTAQKVLGENIAPLLEAEGVDPQKVIESIDEKGALGTVQSALDTLSYLIVDSEMMQEPFYTDAGARVIASIQGIHENRLLVADSAVWQELLEFRAMHMRDVIYHPLNKMKDEAMRRLLRIALNEGYISLEELKNGSDSILRFRLQSLVQEDKGAALFGGRTNTHPSLSRCRELFAMSLGMPDPQQWKQEVYERGDGSETRDELRKKIEEKIATLPQDVQEQVVLLEPYDYTKKKLHVFVEGESSLHEETLQAKTVHLRPVDTQFILLSRNFHQST